MTHDPKRASDYPELPRPLAWLMISIKEIGIPGVVIASLMYVVFWRLDAIQVDNHNNSLAIVNALEKNTTAISALRHFLTHKYDE